MPKKSWKTTVLGILAGTAIIAPQLYGFIASQEDISWQNILFGLFVAAQGIFAKDHDVTGVDK